MKVVIFVLLVGIFGVLCSPFPVHNNYDQFLMMGSVAETMGHPRSDTVRALAFIKDSIKLSPKKLGEWLIGKIGYVSEVYLDFLLKLCNYYFRPYSIYFAIVFNTQFLNKKYVKIINY